VASNPASLAAETELLGTLLHELERTMSPAQLGAGSVFFASSAGGVYAGSSDPPFDERTEPVPLSPYGTTKLEQEALVRAWSIRHGVPTALGRISNLFGPGQNLSKPQGLISQLAWNDLGRQPLVLYVSLDTLRDYLFAPDCGAMVHEALRSAEQLDRSHGPCLTKVMASGRAMSIAAVIGEYRRISKHPVRIATRVSPLTAFQVRDLRLSTRVAPEVDRVPKTTFLVGLRRTYEDLRLQMAMRGWRR
jgi:UDP-glucose 4-epimerase